MVLASSSRWSCDEAEVQGHVAAPGRDQGERRRHCCSCHPSSLMILCPVSPPLFPLLLCFLWLLFLLIPSSSKHGYLVNLHEMILILIIPPFKNVFSLTKYHFAADRQFFCFLQVCLVTWRWAGVRQWLPHIWWEGAPPPQDSVGSTWLCKARPTPYGITRLRIVIVLSTKYNEKI